MVFVFPRCSLICEAQSAEKISAKLEKNAVSKKRFAFASPQGEKISATLEMEVPKPSSPTKNIAKTRKNHPKQHFFKKNHQIICRYKNKPYLCTAFRKKHGRLAQLVQSICLTSRGSAVRIRQRPQPKAVTTML